MDTKTDWVEIALLGLGAYIIWDIFFSTSGPVNQAANSVASGIANAYVNLTSPAAPVPQGSVIMPDGSSFPASGLTGMGLVSGPGSLTFQSNGTTYALSPSDANGNYAATAVN
jgi:hypothetical protein